MKQIKLNTSLGILLLIIGLLQTSCEKFFDPGVSNALPANNAFSDVLASRASVNGLYALSQDIMNSYVILGELRADMLKITADANQDLSDIYHLVNHPGNSYFSQMKTYTLIANCNDVAYHLSEALKRGTSYDTDLHNMYAETISMRTWAYFYLLRTYGDIPYLTIDYTASGASISIKDWLAANGGVNATVDQLILDVQSIIPDFYPASQSISSTQYFNLASAYALIGEMQLWNNDYSAAIESLTSSVQTSTSRFILDADLKTTKWANIFKGDETANDEILTKILFNKAEKQENDFLTLFSDLSPNIIELEPTAAILSVLEGTYRYSGTFYSNEVSKYTRTATDPYTSDMPVILYRAADIHLMLAEAYNNLGYVEVALDLINNGSDSLFTPASMGVRGRLSLPSLTVSGVDLQDSIKNMEDLIIEERGHEMAFEGKRYFDLLRIARRRNDPNYLSDHIQLRFDNPDTTNIKNFFANQDNWYLPFE
ncbi:MAG: RagB/SusD family nutrient uptake outer membrane protein [Bacteroidales bacterium]|nr:RagB/SusD family nutrient uptake outer membrane protein [Bacteroidales bacterium]MCF8389891.1 RagB/SusD family nutrient uptake outer membrane protein [Bacteroidales bacterium]